MSNSSYNPYGDTQPYRPQQQFPQFEDRSERKFPWGCCLGSCAGVALLGLIAACGAGFWAYSAIQGTINAYTSETPVPLPSVEISEEETTAIRDRLKDFQEKFDAGDEPQELVLTIDEINALIAADSNLKERVFVSIQDKKVRADVSIPIGDLLPGGKGRYFNGSATLDVELKNGTLIVTVVSAEANGNQIPETLMKEIRNQNLAKDLYKNPETARTLQRCEGLEIQADRIILKVKQKVQEERDSGTENGADKTGEASDVSTQINTREAR